MRIGEYPPQARHAYEEPPEREASEAGSGAIADILKTEVGALMALGLSKQLISTMQERALSNGTTIEAELLRSGEIREEAYYGAMARLLRLPFVDAIDPALVQDMEGLDSQLLRPKMIRVTYRHRPPHVAIVPEAARLAELAVALATLPGLGRDVVITTAGAIRRVTWAAGAARRGRETTVRLAETRPDHSARRVVTGMQGFLAGAFASALAAALLISPLTTLFFLHVLLSLTYLASLWIRLAALAFKVTRPAVTGMRPVSPGRLPCYTVMVALYREASMVDQLVTSLRRLDWPRSLLDIKLVCEADDTETLAALQALDLPPQFEIIEVPALGPRTKPKALTYALASARGEFLAIYDAEDRPHPQQLREAFARFREGPADLACLQAPLIIANMRATWLSALFALEYSALFRGLLPMLAARRMPLPLGGTSNHFRTAILREAGGWDPFNVTEDADMGLRLYRLGYRSDVLSRQTLEDAPVALSAWMAQRARWFKGWLQTWLVLMREPARLLREMGLLPFLVFQLMVGGMLVSALLHPLIFLFLGMGMAALVEAPKDDLPPGVLGLVIVDIANIIGSYLIFIGLGIGSMIDHEKRLLGWRWAFVPFYWLMISAASWRAVIELKTKPFHWNKTPHFPSRKG
jgi:glycosyltransferase XagB